MRKVYFISDQGNSVIKTKILTFFRGNVSSLSINPYSCRVVQAFLDAACKDKNAMSQNFIVNELKDQTLELIYDHSGNHVIQKLATVCTCKVLQPIIEQINLNVLRII